MGWSNLVFGERSLHNIAKSYINVVNSIATFVEPTLPTNFITNYTILIQYIIKQVLKNVGQKGKDAVWK